MTPEDLKLVEEGLKMADYAISRLMEVDNDHVNHITNMLHAAISFGEVLIETNGTKQDQSKGD